MGWSNGMTSATQQLHQLTKNIELCAISLHRSIYPDSALQRPTGCYCGMDRGQGHGSKFRDLHDRVARSVYRGRWQLPPRWRVELPRGRPACGESRRDL